jgi:arylformamidase
VNALAAALRSATLFDLSTPLDERTAVFPGHPAVTVDKGARTHACDGYFLQHIGFGEHTGAHVDAPAHARADLAERTIDTYPVERFVAPYVKYDLSSEELAPGTLVRRTQLEAAERRDGAPEPGDVALLQFGWDRHRRDESSDPDERSWWIRNTPGLAEDACALLVEREVGGVGSDTATCDAAAVDGVIVSAVGHQRLLLPNDILLFESLAGLARIPSRGIFVGLPLAIRGGSGSPVRAIVIAERDEDSVATGREP